MSSGSSNKVIVYDTTLRDGAQRKGISLSVSDKLRIAVLLDSFGVDYIEGGWPGSNPKDNEFFRRIKEHRLKKARIVAFGSTRKAGMRVNQDQNLNALKEAATPVVALVGKASLKQVENVLRTSACENLKMIEESVAYLKDREVIFDAEHFFDGFKENPQYAMKCLEAAARAGARWLVLCDTNGGTMPSEIKSIVESVSKKYPDRIGVHCHNDCELAVANSIAAVESGARHIQGTINGYGERCGNANLVSLIPNLQLKLGFDCIAPQQLKRLSEISRCVSEIANLSPDPYQAYVGSAAFAHKAGLHASAVERYAASYEHMPPETIGNSQDILISELAGRSNMRLLARQLKLLGKEEELVGKVKELERKGYKFEDAQGSIELMIRRSQDLYKAPFTFIDMMVSVRNGRGRQAAEAVVKVDIRGQTTHTVSDGDGPVHALDCALRKALLPSYPQLEKVKLVDYKVRILDSDKATAATVRVVIEAACGKERWSTVGCSENIIEASCQALSESMELFLSRFDQIETKKEEDVA